MPFARPTLSELRTQVLNSIAAALQGSDPLLRFAVLRIVGIVLAGMTNEHYGYLDWIAKNCVPFTAQGEYLYAWGALKGVTLKPAALASGETTFSDCVAGTLIADGSILVRGDGIEYITTADATIAVDGTAVVPAIARIAGAVANTPVGSILTLGNSIAGIQTDSLVSTAFVGGADIETEEDFRGRMLKVYRDPPQGGSRADYEKWALEVPGVTRAWCVPLGMGVGTVLVLFMMDDVRSAFGGFPQGTNGVAAGEGRASPATGDQLLVADYIFEPTRQPVPALVYTAGPNDSPTAFTIHGIADADVRAAVGQAIDDVFLAVAVPGGTTNLLDIEAAIAAVPGTAGAYIVAPVVNIVAAAGALSTRGAITWT